MEKAKEIFGYRVTSLTEAIIYTVNCIVLSILTPTIVLIQPVTHYYFVLR